MQCFRHLKPYFPSINISGASHFEKKFKVFLKHYLIYLLELCLIFLSFTLDHILLCGARF